MTVRAVAVEGDEEYAEAAHDPPAGAGYYPITPVTLQERMSIDGLPVVLRGQAFAVHCSTAAAGTGSPANTRMSVDGYPVCLHGDISVDGPHALTGIQATHQSRMTIDE